MPTRLRFLSCLLAVSLVCPFPSAAFDTPLSDTAVREAYFIGQRHDESVALFFDKYAKHLSQPPSGPYISTVSFLTPFALLVEHSSRQSNYSAQKAQLDHHSDLETVSIRIEVLLTNSYGPFLSKRTGPRSGSPVGIQLRPSNFWREIKFQFFDGKEEIVTESIHGQPQYQCTEDGCLLTGANIEADFPAEAFTSSDATILITPPDEEPVAVDFDLSAFR